jgi:hypothetical protein
MVLIRASFGLPFFCLRITTQHRGNVAYGHLTKDKFGMVQYLLFGIGLFGFDG